MSAAELENALKKPEKKPGKVRTFCMNAYSKAKKIKKFSMKDVNTSVITRFKKDELDLLRHTKPNELLVPHLDYDNLPAIDGLILPNKFFQMTCGSTHTISSKLKAEIF